MTFLRNPAWAHCKAGARARQRIRRYLFGTSDSRPFLRTNSGSAVTRRRTGRSGIVNVPPSGRWRPISGSASS